MQIKNESKPYPPKIKGAITITLIIDEGDINYMSSS